MNSVKENRNDYIGGSDIPIILGLSPFKSRFELLQEKAGLVKVDFEGNEYTDYGDIMEPKIRKYLEQRYNKTFKETRTIKEKLRYHSDGDDEDTVIEIKTTGSSGIRKNVKSYKKYLVQLLLGMDLQNKQKGILAVYERPKDFDENFTNIRLQTFDIDINDYTDTLNEIKTGIELFLKDLERIKENPFLEEHECM